MVRRVLIIEDDHQTAQALTAIAKELAFEVEHVSDGAAGLSLASTNTFALVILDLGLPTVDGFDICRTLRQRKPNVPIIIVTSRGLETDKVLGLEFGADDYLVKPFAEYELRARIKAVIRRCERVMTMPEVVEAGAVRLDSSTRSATVNGTPVELTALEFDLLLFFATSPGRVFSRQELMNAVWGFEASSFGPSITTQISRLRNKIEPEPSRPRYLLTVHGVGYRLAG